MNFINNKKRLLVFGLLIAPLFIVVGVMVYFGIAQKSTEPIFNPSNDLQIKMASNAEGQTITWANHQWGLLKFKYPSSWKIEAASTSVIKTGPTSVTTVTTSVILIPPSNIISQTQAAEEDIITISEEKPCSALGEGYRCESLYGLSIFTTSNNSEIITVFQEIINSARLDITVYDIETGFTIETVNYTVNNKNYTEDEFNLYLKKAPPGRYDFVVKASGYEEEVSWYIILPASRGIGRGVPLSSISKPPELSDTYLQQFIKPGTGLIVGFVRDEDGKPLPDVSVNSPVYNTTTTNRGFYALNAVIPESASCEGIEITFSKSGYKTFKVLHAASGTVLPRNTGDVPTPPFWDFRLNVKLERGTGENVDSLKHLRCP